jgi:hypothetical protein
MNKNIPILILGIFLLGAAHVPRDRKQVAAFKRNHPCPSTNKSYGACPGYIVDHKIPLCAGGPDRASNMQWQTKTDSLIKDKSERELCRKLR